MINGNIERCVRCDKNIIQEEFKEHTCNPLVKGIKDIVVSHMFESQKPENNGDKVIFVKGIDGTMYRIIHCAHNPPHGNSSKFLNFSTNRRVTRTRSTEDETEPINNNIIKY